MRLQLLIKKKKVTPAVQQYRKGNHDGALAGILAGLALLGGWTSQTFAGSFNSVLGNYANDLGDFLGIIGFAALVGGIMEYRYRRIIRK